MPAPQSLQRLSPLHEEAAMLVAQGYALVEIAAHCEVTPQALQHWTHSPLFQDRVQDIQRELQAESFKYAVTKMALLQSRAVDRLEYLMSNAHSEAVQLGATREILERGPLRVQRHADQKVTTGAIVLSKDMLIAMKQVAEMTGDNGLLETIDPMLASQHEETLPEAEGEPEDMPLETE